MANTIASLFNSPGLISPSEPFAPEGRTAGDGVGFQQLLKDAIQSTAALQSGAQQAVQSRLAGGDVTSVEVLSDVRKADLALRLLLQIRNKLLEAYNEIKQMQF